MEPIGFAMVTLPERHFILPHHAMQFQKILSPIANQLYQDIIFSILDNVNLEFSLPPLEGVEY